MKLGMDFGTTTSATVALLHANNSRRKRKILCGDEDGRPVPSAIAINRETGDVFRGREASNRKSELSQSCEYVHSIKTYLGKDYIREIAGRRLSPADIAGEVMKGLVENVQRKTKEFPTSMTVAVPVGFSPEKRADIRKAAALAGLDIDAFVSEPTAAFFANYADLKSAANIAVFDWGGGTLDVSVLHVRDNGVEERGTAGLAEGGDNLDQEIAMRMHNRFARNKGRTDIDFKQMPPMARDTMLVQCERAKRRLGDEDVAQVLIPRYGELGGCRDTLEYDWFADITRPLIDSAIECLDRALAQANMPDAALDYLVMTGGSSNLRPLVERLEPRFGDRLYFPEETMWNVAEGAAMLAANPGAYKSAQDVDLILAGGERFRLLSEGERLLDWKLQCSFGITDATDEARLVIDMGCPGSGNFLVLHVPSYGFLHEKIILDASVTRDQVLVLSARSGRRPPDSARTWMFPNLRVYYEFPQGVY